MTDIKADSNNSRKAMKTIKCRFIPENFCVNIFGTAWARDTSRLDKYILNHESIHTAQMRELLFVPFYVLYALEWLWHFIRLRKWYVAYMAISFEREAYEHGDDLSYLKNRRHYAMWRKKKTKA